MIIKGTTPTIRYTFSHIDTEDIVAAVLSIKQNDKTIIEKTLADAVIEEGSASWRLTQEDTLKLRRKIFATIYLDYLLGDGTRAAGKTRKEMVGPTGKEEVLTDE